LDPVIPYNRIVLGKQSNQAAAYLIVNIKENVLLINWAPLAAGMTALRPPYLLAFVLLF